MKWLVLLAVYSVTLAFALARAGHRSAAARKAEAPARRPLRLLIVGATGGTGRRLVEQSLERKRYLGPSRILSEGTRNILRAMEARGTARLVCETSLGIGDSAGRLREGGSVGGFLMTPRISRADVATFMLDQLESNTHLRTAPGISW